MGLHGDLQKEISQVLPKDFDFKYFANLSEFIACFDEDGAAGAEAFVDALRETGYRGFQIDTWIEENLVNMLDGDDHDGVKWTGLPYHAEAPELIDLLDLVSLEIHSPKACGVDKIEFFCDLAIVGAFECRILFSAWNRVVHPMQVLWVDETSSEHWTYIGVKSVATYMLRLEFDLNQLAICGQDITTIEHDYESATVGLEEVRRINKEFDEE